MNSVICAPGILPAGARCCAAKHSLLGGLLILFGCLIGAIGIEIHEHEIAERGGDLGAREHIGLHPVAVGAGVTGEVHEDQLALAARAVERLAVLVFHPDRRADAPDL